MGRSRHAIAGATRSGRNGIGLAASGAGFRKRRTQLNRVAGDRPWRTAYSAVDKPLSCQRSTSTRHSDRERCSRLGTLSAPVACLMTATMHQRAVPRTHVAPKGLTASATTPGESVMIHSTPSRTSL